MFSFLSDFRSDGSCCSVSVLVKVAVQSVGRSVGQSVSCRRGQRYANAKEQNVGIILSSSTPPVQHVTGRHRPIFGSNVEKFLSAMTLKSSVSPIQYSCGCSYGQTIKWTLSPIHIVVSWVVMPPIEGTNVSGEPAPPFTYRRPVYSSETVNMPARLHGVKANKTAVHTVQIVAVFVIITCFIRDCRVDRVAVTRAATEICEAVLNASCVAVGSHQHCCVVL
jgi:hypothetical protein